MGCWALGDEWGPMSQKQAALTVHAALDAGDPAWTTDFRSVYASLIEGWFGVEHQRVLGARYPLLPLFR